MINFTILVVDDNAEIRELLRVMLESKGYTVLEAENGMEAIECVKSTPGNQLDHFGHYDAAD